MPENKTLERKIALRIARRKSPVILRKDFADLGGYDQVGRALRALASKGMIVKIGYGLYARTKPSYFTPGQTVLEKNLPEIAREALRRLGVKPLPSTLEKDYNAGRTTQVPSGRLIGVKGRISRKIGYNRVYVSYERLTG